MQLVGHLSQLMALFEGLQDPNLYVEHWWEYISAVCDCGCAFIHQECPRSLGPNHMGSSRLQ